MKIALNTKTNIDLQTLIESRLLVQANSGGGKSYAIRRIIEQSFDKVQIIVLDPEGEFGNLRSEFDFVYAGKGGDAPVESRSAALLAHRLLELKASAIIDLYELPPQERKHFVRLFCEALVNAPKELWHDALIIIDEAHVFAPEKDQSESLSAIIDLASRGRKRGYCAVLATQRPAKLNKDAAAECNNKLIGRASLDIDRKRASEELGFSTKESVLSLRDLEPGEFYAFGPAISRDVSKLKIGEVKVKPPKRGVNKGHIAAPSATVRKILGRLADLPQEAAQEAKTIAELKAENATLKRHKCEPVSSGKPSEEDIQKALEPHLIALASERNAWKLVVESWEQYGKDLLWMINHLFESAKAARIPSNKLGVTYSGKMPATKRIGMSRRDVENLTPARVPVPSDGTISKGERILLNAIGQYPEEGISMEHIAVLTGYKQTSRREYTRKLLAGGYIERKGEDFIITQHGLDSLGDDFVQIPTQGQALRDHVMQTLPEGEKRVLSAIMSYDGPSVTREYIETETGYKTTSVREYSRKLAARKLITIEGGRINLSDKLKV